MIGKHFLAVTAAVAILVAAIGLSRTAEAAAPKVVATTFRLQVAGHSATDTTFWVAYGPLAGHFGIVQLHRTPDGAYGATVSLPVQGTTVFSYIAGHGVMHSRLGDVPGNPVITIRSIGPVAAARLRPAVVRWAPVG